MIDFLKYKKIYFAISLLLLIPSAASLAVWGLRPSIDFTGGTLVELKFDEKSKCQNPNVKETLHDMDIGLTSMQFSGVGNCLLKSKPLDETKKNEIVGGLQEKFGEIEVVRFETVGPTLGKELLTKTLIAVVLAITFILGYVAWQFKDKMYGVCAILGMFHDTLILLGTFSLLGHFFGIEIDTLFVTAVLTTLSFSVHDTVVVFNSIREAVGSNQQSASSSQRFEEAVNRAINATIVRSLNNSFTIIFMLLCLVLLGGETVRWFAAALLIGTILGTYSSTFITAPLLTVWRGLATRSRKISS